jgi:hypothetical protein
MSDRERKLHFHWARSRVSRVSRRAISPLVLLYRSKYEAWMSIQMDNCPLSVNKTNDVLCCDSSSPPPVYHGVDRRHFHNDRHLLRAIRYSITMNLGRNCMGWLNQVRGTVSHSSWRHLLPEDENDLTSDVHKHFSPLILPPTLSPPPPCNAHMM